MEHLGEGDFEGFWDDRLDSAGMQRILRHLVSGCSSCRSRLLAAQPPEMPFWKLERPPDDVYDIPIERAWQTVRKLLPRIQEDKERRDLGLALFRERGDWSNITESEQRSFKGAWPHIEILLQRGFDARYRNPQEMLDLLQAAARAVDGIPGWRYGKSLLFDLQARVWGELGNGYRVNERYQEAEVAFQTANSLLNQGTGDLVIQAHLCDLESSLRRAQRHIDKALKLLDQACRTYRRLGDQYLAGRMLMQKGTCLLYTQRPQEAVRWLRQAIKQLDSARDPQLAATASHNLLDALIESGNFREAGRELFKSGLRLRFAEDPLNLNRVRWVEAKILAGRGRLADAEQVFCDVREGFRKHGLTYVAALVGMDLALVRVKQGKDVHDLAAELHAECQAHGVNPEAVQALKIFELLGRHKAVTVPRVERLRGFLVQLQQSPRLRLDLEQAVSG
jgi:tetratricopeptide (TPR) repeat protein